MAMPTPAAYQMLAAVVTFVTFRLLSDFRMIPAPKKPMPDTICAAIRLGSPLLSELDKKANIIDPDITSVCVLIPAGFPLSSRSAPISSPQTTATVSPSKKSHSRALIKPSNIPHQYTIRTIHHSKNACERRRKCYCLGKEIICQEQKRIPKSTC